MYHLSFTFFKFSSSWLSEHGRKSCVVTAGSFKKFPKFFMKSTWSTQTQKSGYFLRLNIPGYVVLLSVTKILLEKKEQKLPSFGTTASSYTTQE